MKKISSKIILITFVCSTLLFIPALARDKEHNNYNNNYNSASVQPDEHHQPRHYQCHIENIGNCTTHKHHVGEHCTCKNDHGHILKGHVVSH